MTRSEVVGMSSFIQKKFVQNMVRVVQDVCEKVVHISSHLRRPGIDGSVKAESNSTSCRCFNMLLVCRACKTPSCRWCIQQLGEDNCFVDVPRRVVTHAVMAQQLQGMQWLRALADNVADICSPAKRWFVMVTPSILMEVTRRTSGICCGRPWACLRLLFVNMISANFALLSLRLLFCAHHLHDPVMPIWNWH